MKYTPWSAHVTCRPSLMRDAPYMVRQFKNETDAKIWLIHRILQFNSYPLQCSYTSSLSTHRCIRALFISLWNWQTNLETLLLITGLLQCVSLMSELVTLLELWLKSSWTTFIHLRVIMLWGAEFFKSGQEGCSQGFYISNFWTCSSG